MWKDVVGYEDLFMISDEGKIYSKRSKKELKQNLVGKGYLAHTTKIGGRKGKNVVLKTHQLVAKAFIENPMKLPHVNHKDGNKLNNHVSNLEWCTQKENVQHSVSTGLSDFSSISGHKNIYSKLNEDQIFFIRKNSRRYGGNITLREMAKMFGVTHSTISSVVMKRTYK